MDPGKIVQGRYRIDGITGAGGMAVVHRATDLTTGAPVALKMLHEGIDEGELRRFVREAELLAQLEHDGIVGYRAHDGGAEMPWLAMEWLDGSDLAKRIARGPLPLEVALAITRDVLRALAYLHQHGIVHRDLKPSNIFLVENGVRAKLIDLGIAYLEDTDATALTAAGTLLGTPLYMSPEQARGEVTDERADVWAVGAVLFEMLTKEAPFRAGTNLGVLTKILMGDIPRLSARLPTVPAWVDFAVHRALSRDRSVRPGTAEGLLALLADDRTVTTIAPASSSVERERRLTIVLFAEPSTTEQGRAVLHDLETMGGHVEPVRGGFLVARFGVDRSGAADAHLCARAAAAVRRVDPAARIAIALAPTTTGGDINEVLERGVDLLGAAAPGELVVDGDTAVVVGPLLDESASAYRVLETTASPRSGLAENAPILGRETELGHLEGICRTVWEERAPLAMVVVGEPGIGKSRLVSGLLARLGTWTSPPWVLSCRGEPLLMDAPFETVRAALGRSGPDVPPAKEFSILLERRLANADEGLDPEQWRMRLGSAFEAWARDLAADRLLIIELDDLQWIDGASIELVTRLLGCTDFAALLLATARPEIGERFPNLFDGLPSERIDLRPLSAKAAERMARVLVPIAEGPPIADLVRRSGGNPLFLRELARTLVLRGGTEALPSSLAFLIQLRMDALPSLAREVCRVAAAFGDRAWVEGIDFVVGRSCAREIIVLEQADMLKATASSLKGCSELAFRHALYRETAQTMTVDADARGYHGRIFEWLRPRTERWELLAYHAARAGLLDTAADLYAAAADEADRVYGVGQVVAHLTRAIDLGVQAKVPRNTLLTWLERLELALATSRSPDAVPTLENALAYVETTGTETQRLVARLAVAGSMSSVYEYTRADELFDTMQQPAEAHDARVATALMKRVTHSYRKGRFAEARRFLDRASDQVGDDGRFQFYLLEGQVLAALKEARLALAAMQLASDVVPESPTARVDFLKANSLVYYFLGEDALSVEQALLGAAAAEAARLPYQHAVLLHNAGDGLLNLGELARARDTLQRSREITHKHGYELLDVYNRALLAYIDIDEAGVKGAHVIEQAARFVRAVGSTWVAIVLDLLHARVLGRTGDRARARALAERVEREAKEHGHMRTSGDATKLIAEIDGATRPSR